MIEIYTKFYIYAYILEKMYYIQMELDEIDIKILKILQENAKQSLEDMSEMLKLPKSTIAYRIKRLESQGIIKGYYAHIDPYALDQDYIVITFVRAKYGKDYHLNLGSKLAEIPGVWGVYFVLGDTDFVVMARYKNREEFMKNFLEKLMSMPEIERTSTQIVVKTIKEAPNIVIY
ncbi:ArsR family transcriptional regulator [Sulfolobus acidocaldarius]|uniref:Transcriptional regulator AsnC family n=6 Tax=Sulfolobus acidocaldarius TaxID=2285 RepID=Q4J717_SULAC|nr:transcriptional regulator AsnC family [Sulfolobus acidocaldarius DSM 639]AGE72029.1 AsnC family transcriptional regulator [Sulfolobus acidocaldarius N8]AGE74346.1 AsnC family transcriptional regulator [Sulfolobus acidocaldarius Ron12/I]ALU30609.1 ArsR family transcriptional regulator [Sulfolobus acidocaldarius]ALU32871.1 ArsR family transcriptional regulator [Sulfolobus acidocaldarius]